MNILSKEHCIKKGFCYVEQCCELLTKRLKIHNIMRNEHYFTNVLMTYQIINIFNLNIFVERFVFREEGDGNRRMFKQI